MKALRRVKQQSFRRIFCCRILFLCIAITFGLALSPPLLCARINMVFYGCLWRKFLGPMGLQLIQHDTLWGGAIQFVHAKEGAAAAPTEGALQ